MPRCCTSLSPILLLCVCGVLLFSLTTRDSPPVWPADGEWKWKWNEDRLLEPLSTAGDCNAGPDVFVGVDLPVLLPEFIWTHRLFVSGSPYRSHFPSSTSLIVLPPEPGEQRKEQQRPLLFAVTRHVQTISEYRNTEINNTRVVLLSLKQYRSRISVTSLALDEDKKIGVNASGFKELGEPLELRVHPDLLPLDENGDMRERAVVGFEDPRSVTILDDQQPHKQLLELSASQQQYMPVGAQNNSKVRMAVFTFDRDNGTVLSIRSFGSPDSHKRRAEKNWMIFRLKGDLLAIHSFHPFILVNLTEGAAAKVAEDGPIPPLASGLPLDTSRNATPYYFSAFRGSAGPILWNPTSCNKNQGRKKELLLAVHTQHPAPDGKRWPYYKFRFLTLDYRTFAPLRISRPFRLHEKQKGIEYLVGLASIIVRSDRCKRRDDQGKNNAVVLGYSIEDSQAWVSVLCTETVEEMLVPLDKVVD